MVRFLAVLMLLAGFGAAASADTIVLKNGRRIDVEQAWQEGGIVKGNLYGSVVQYPRDEVAQILTDAPPVDYQQLRFSHWQLGMTQEQVLAKAQSNGISLRSQDPSAVPGIPEDEPQQPGDGFRYDAELLGRRAGVQLDFTPQTRKLWRIQVVWRGDINMNQSRLKKDIIKHYRNEYGSPSGHLQHSWFSENIHWTVGGSGAIRLQTRKGILELAYSDAILERQYERELARSEGGR